MAMTAREGNGRLVILDIHILWECVLADEPGAWGQLVKRYVALVNTVALRAGLTMIDAEDCAQHTWMSLYRSRHSIKDPQRLPVWLIRTTRRQAVKMMRRMHKSSLLDAGYREISVAPLPDEEVVLLERQVVLESALEQMDERCQKLLHALFFAPDHISYREIAKSLNIASNTMGPLRSRCLKRLRRLLEEMGYSVD